MSQGLQAGAAYSIYRLDLRGFDQDVARIRRELADIEEQARRPLPAPRLPSPTAPSGGGGGSGPGNESAAQTLRLAQAQARLQASSGNTAAAIRTLRQALEGMDRSSVAAIRAETQLVQLQQRLVRETTSAATSTRSYAQSFLALAGPLGVATTGIGAFMAVAGRVKEGFELRATLDEQRRSVGTLLGDVERGNQVFAKAAAFGRQYGFTQKEMGEAAEQAADLIRQSNVATEKQLEILGRLASRNTREGFAGAVFSTKELASGDITSIVERFNLGRKAANEMKQAIADGADVFQVLDAQLTRMGVTADVLSNRMQGAAGATRTFAQAQEDLTLALGQLAEGPGVKVLDFLSSFTSTLTNIVSKGDAFAGAASGADAIQARIVGLATSYEDYGKRLSAVNGQVRDEISKTDPVFAALVGSIEQLTPAQFAYAQSLIQTGTAQAQAVQQAQSLTDVARQLSAVQDTASVSNQAAAAALTELSGQILQAAAASPAAADGVLAMASAMASGELGVENFRTALAGLIAHNEAAAQAATTQAAAEQFRAGEHQISVAAVQSNTSATQLNAEALVEQLTKAQESALATQQLSNAQTLLASLGGAVANGQLTAANGALQFANAAGIAYGEALKLIQAQAALAKEKVAIQAQQDFRAGERNPGVRSAAEQRAQAEADRAQARAKEEAAAAERRYQQVLGNTGPELAHLRSELAKTNKGSAEYFDTLTKIEQLEGKGKRKGGGGAKLDDAAKLNNKLLANQEQYQAKAEDAARKHEEALLKIERDFDEKSLAQQRLNEGKKRESRYTFYRSLANAGEDLGEAEAQAYSAAYEQAFAESQKLAQDGQHKLAADRLALRQQQIQQDIEAAKEIAEAEREGNTKRAESLKQLEVLRKDSQAEDLKQLEAGGDQLVNDRLKAIDDENARYEGAQDKNALAAERKAERAVNAAEREKKALGDVNELLAKQNALYGNNSRPATSPPPSSTAVTTPSEGATSSTPAAAAQDAARLTAVVDTAVVGAIETQTRMQEQKFDATIAAIDGVGRRIGDVERAVKALQGRMAS